MQDHAKQEREAFIAAAQQRHLRIVRLWYALHSPARRWLPLWMALLLLSLPFLLDRCVPV